MEEVTKRLEIFSELNDAYQALIDNLKGVQQDQSKHIDQLQKTIETLLQEQQRSATSTATPPVGGESAGEAIVPPPASVDSAVASTSCPTCSAVLTPTASSDHLKVLDITADDFVDDAVEEEEAATVVDVPLETEIIYDFVV